MPVAAGAVWVKELVRGIVVVTKPPEFWATPLAEGLGGIGSTGFGGGVGVTIGGLGRVPV